MAIKLENSYSLGRYFVNLRHELNLMDISPDTEMELELIPTEEDGVYILDDFYNIRESSRHLLDPSDQRPIALFFKDKMQGKVLENMTALELLNLMAVTLDNPTYAASDFQK